MFLPYATSSQICPHTQHYFSTAKPALTVGFPRIPHSTHLSGDDNCTHHALNFTRFLKQGPWLAIFAGGHIRTTTKKGRKKTQAKPAITTRKKTNSPRGKMNARTKQKNLLKRTLIVRAVAERNRHAQTNKKGLGEVGLLSHQHQHTTTHAELRQGPPEGRVRSIDGLLARARRRVLRQRSFAVVRGHLLHRVRRHMRGPTTEGEASGS